MKEFIIPIEDNEKNMAHRFIGAIRAHEELIRCKDCIHRPKRIDDEGNGFDYEFPDYKCPCQCDDPWYNWMPKDNWFCGNGERKEE